MLYPRLSLHRFFLLALLCSGMALLFAGCQAQSSGHVDIDAAPLDRRIGMIKSLGANISGQGTHILQLDDGDTVLLKSLSINLGESRYQMGLVEVRGLITYTNDARPLMEVMNIDVLDIEPEDEKEALEWKDYSNTEYGFLLRARSDFTVKESIGGVRLEREIRLEDGETLDVMTDVTESESEDVPVDVVEITTEKRAEGENLASFLGLKDLESSTLLGKGMTMSRVGSYAAVKKMGGTEGDITFYVESDDLFYTLAFTSGDKADSLEGENLFFEILNTFKLQEITADEDETVDEDEEEAADEDAEKDEVVEEKTAPAEVEKEEPEKVEEEAVTSTIKTEDIPAVKGYTIFEHESLGFSVKYPSNWYFQGTVSGQPGTLRHYDFGVKIEPEESESESSSSTPSDDDEDSFKIEPIILFDVLTGDIPAGTPIQAGGLAVTRVTKGGTIEFYTEGSDGRVYKVSGPTATEETLLTMIGSVSVQ